MNLFIAWVTSALAGSVVFSGGGLLAAVILGAPIMGLSPRAWRFAALIFAVGLIVQLVYGGFLYLVLRRIGLFTLPIIILAYLIPVTWFVLGGMDRSKDLIMSIPQFAWGVTLPLVAWLILSSSQPQP